MNRLSALLATLSPFLLCQCYVTTQPMGTGGRPYSQQQSAYQSNVRAYDQGLIQRTYEEGIRSGQIDQRGRQTPDHRRYAGRYNASTEKAFADGYQQGFYNNQSPYQQPGRPTQPGYGSNTPPPYPSAPSQPTAADSTKMYNQGYDYGMRDRAARHPRDPSAHTGSLDPWSRQSFEKGYLDAFNALPNGR